MGLCGPSYRSHNEQCLGRCLLQSRACKHVVHVYFSVEIQHLAKIIAGLNFKLYILYIYCVHIYIYIYINIVYIIVYILYMCVSLSLYIYIYIHINMFFIAGLNFKVELAKMTLL